MDTSVFKIDFENVKIKFEIEVSYFREYILFNCERLTERKKKLNVLMLQEIAETPENTLALEQIYDEEKLRIPSYFHHSTIVSLYSLLENNLNEICDIIVNKTDFVFKLNDISDK